MTFTDRDLADLDRLLQRARDVAAMREIAAGNHRSDVIGLRHDIDDNRDSFPTAVELARWEAERGYRSTYYVLHTASYWDGPGFRDGLEEIALAGHEIGLHVNGLAEALKTGADPHLTVLAALETLRGYGHAVTGAASHGDEICRPVGFVNYEQFTDCAKRDDPTRTLVYQDRELTFVPLPLAAFGLTYEAYHLPRAAYLSDTGGAWNQPREHDFQGQLHVLMHPDWWGKAFAPEPVAA